MLACILSTDSVKMRIICNKTIVVEINIVKYLYNSNKYLIFGA